MPALPPIRLYNTLTRQKETFAPVDGVVRVYVCGVTPYDTTHLGHTRTYVFFDTLVRYLRSRELAVRYVQNITDIDESILQRARRDGVDWDELGRRWFSVYREDMRRLNVLPADTYPPATGEIEGIQRITEKLIATGHAYVAADGVYFRVRSAPEYGRLSRLDRPAMIAITAKQDDADLDNPAKEDPLDFPLWRLSAPDEPSWESRWGPGRPGWHIECSAIGLDHLGPTIDIHGGGKDLIFPHHESEIAQSEAFSGVHPFARFWVHTGMVNLDGVKMSKSLGNMVFARDLLRENSADAIRLYVLSRPYRDPFEHQSEALAEFQTLAERLAHLARTGSETAATPAALREFHERMSDDLDTPGVINLLQRLVERGTGGAAVRAIAMTWGLRLDGHPR